MTANSVVLIIGCVLPLGLAMELPVENKEKLPEIVLKWLAVVEAETNDVGTRADAVAELVKIGDNRSMPRLLKILPGRTDYLATKILQAVPLLKYPAALPLLLEYEKDIVARKIRLQSKTATALTAAIQYCRSHKE